MTGIRLTSARWTARHAGGPVLDDCVAWFVGAIERGVDLGDHVRFLLEPVEVAEARVGDALMLDAVGGLDAGHEA